MESSDKLLLKDPFERLKEGDVDYFINLSVGDIFILIRMLKQVDKEERKEIIKGFIDKALDIKPKYCFDLVFDEKDFQEETIYLITNYIESEYLDEAYKGDYINYFKALLSKEFIEDNLEKLEKVCERLFTLVLGYILDNFSECNALVMHFAWHPNLHIRSLFMKLIVQQYPNLLGVIYEDLLSVLVINDGDKTILMDQDDISNLAVAIFNSSLDKSLWWKLRQYILDNYPTNSLGGYLLEKYPAYDEEEGYTDLKERPEALEEFKRDADLYFLTSARHKYYIYLEQSESLSNNVCRKLEILLSHYGARSLYHPDIERIYKYGLGQKLEELTEKYLDLSKSKITRFIGSGTCASCYQIGDYAIKLVSQKYSREETLVPRSYLILPTFEEEYVRNANNCVLAGIEVQRLLTRSAIGIPSSVLLFFKEELRKQGYRLGDTLINGQAGDNCMLLDSYLDADCEDPESLPNTFKEYPLVLIDRDQVYKLSYN